MSGHEERIIGLGEVLGRYSVGQNSACANIGTIFRCWLARKSASTVSAHDHLVRPRRMSPTKGETPVVRDLSKQQSENYDAARRNGRILKSKPYSRAGQTPSAGTISPPFLRTTSKTQ
jgi:hypothetical protein